MHVMMMTMTARIMMIMTLLHELVLGHGCMDLALVRIYILLHEGSDLTSQYAPSEEEEESD
jgi:hypothetical protein